MKPIFPAQVPAPELASLLAKGYAELRHDNGLETVALTARTLAPENIRDVYAETVNYLRTLEESKAASAEKDLLSVLERLSFGRKLALAEAITADLLADEPAEHKRAGAHGNMPYDLLQQLRASVSDLPDSPERARLQELLGQLNVRE